MTDTNSSSSSNDQEYEKKIEELEDKIADIEILLERISDYEQRASTSANNASQSETALKVTTEQAAKLLESFNDDKDALEEIFSEKEELSGDLAKATQDLDGFDKKLEKHDTSINFLREKLEDHIKRAGSALEELEKAQKQAADFVGSITSSSLLGAYGNEARDRDGSARFQLFLLVSSLVAMTAIASHYISTGVFQVTNIDGLLSIIPRLILFVPLSLIALVANRQLKINMQMREEYAHKASLSQSFEGYRKLIEDSPDLFKEFFRKTVEELCKNPAEKIEETENELDMIGKVGKILHKVPEIVESASKLNNSNKVVNIASVRSKTNNPRER